MLFPFLVFVIDSDLFLQIFAGFTWTTIAVSKKGNRQIYKSIYFVRICNNFGIIILVKKGVYMKKVSTVSAFKGLTLKAVMPLLVFASLFVVLVLAVKAGEITTGWNKNFTGNLSGYASLSLANDRAYAITADSSGNIFIGGYGTALVSTLASGSADWWIKKFTPSGSSEDKTAWDITLDGGANNSDLLYSLDMDSSNNLYAVGTWVNLSSSSQNWHIQRFNSSGHQNSTWNITRSFGSSSSTAYGSAIDSNNNLLVVGGGSSLVNSTSWNDWHIEKYNSNAVLQWDANYTDGWTTTNTAEQANVVVVDGTGNAYVGGAAYYLNGERPFDNFGFLSGGSDLDWLILKYSSAGVLNTTWNASYDGSFNATDIIHDLAIDSAGNIIAVGEGTGLVNQTLGGYGFSKGSGTDWLIRKYAPSGTLLWSANYSALSQLATDVAYSVQVDNSNNIYVTGSWSNSTGLNRHIKKFNSNGVENASWNKTISAPSGYSALSFGALLNGSNFITVGYGNNLNGTTGDDWWIESYVTNDASGAEYEAWNKNFTGNLSGYGSLSVPYDYIYASTADSSGNLYFGGTGQGLVDTQATAGVDWWIKKFTSSGTEDKANWDIAIDGGRNSSSEVLRGLDTDSSNNLYAVGSWVNSTDGAQRWHIQRFNTSGHQNNTWNITNTAGYYSSAFDTVVDSSNNVFVVGYGYHFVNTTSQNDWHVEKYNSNGVLQWEANYTDGLAASDVAYTAVMENNGNLFVAGTSSYLEGVRPFDNFGILSGGSKDDWLILKYSTAGVLNTTWNVSYDSSVNGSDTIHDIAIDSAGNVIAVGSGLGLVNQTVGQFGAIGSGQDWLVRKYTSTGVLSWSYNASNLAQNKDDVAYAIAVDNNNSIYVGGTWVNDSGTNWHIKRLLSNGVVDTDWDKTIPNGVNTANLYTLLLNETSLYAGGDAFNLNGSTNSDWQIKKYNTSAVASSANIPEWGDYLTLLILVSVVGGFLLVRKRQEE